MTRPNGTGALTVASHGALGHPCIGKSRARHGTRGTGKLSGGGFA